MKQWVNYNHLNVKWPIRWSDVPGSHQRHVHQGPDPEAAEAEQFPDPLLPVAEVEPVRPKPAQGDGEQHGGVPAIALRPVTLPPLAEHLLAQAQRVRLHAAVGDVPVGFATWGSYTSTTWRIGSIKLI